MTDRESVKTAMRQWIVDAISNHGGAATIVEVARHIWTHHRSELEAAGDLFITGQYDMRWVAQRLRDKGILEPTTRKDPRWTIAR